MKEHRTAAACDTRPRVVIDLDYEIIEAVIALEAVAILIAAAPDRLI